MAEDARRRWRIGGSIKETEFRPGMRGRGAFWAHAGQEAAGKIRYHGAKFARFLGVATSSANRMAVDQETPELKKYLKML